jgi:RimJ/RimL family protein N-acetyltransferase
MFGIVADESLIGRIDPVAIDPPRFGLAYWVSEERTRVGIASAAVAAIIVYAHRSLGATDVYAGVSHGNTASERVLDRNGFARVDRFDTYDRFHRRMSDLAACADNKSSNACRSNSRLLSDVDP